MATQDSKRSTEFTEYGIPIRNLWHMLLYAWNEVPLDGARSWTMAYAEQAPTLDALLALILIKLMQQRLRIGLGHDYVEQEQKVAGIRGRIQFGESLKQRTLDRGQMICEFQKYSANSPKNQIIRTTLARLMKAGHFGADSASVKVIHQQLRQLIGNLDGFDFIVLSPELLRGPFVSRNDHAYR